MKLDPSKVGKSCCPTRVLNEDEFLIDQQEGNANTFELMQVPWNLISLKLRY
jgi:hypothetical protein